MVGARLKNRLMEYKRFLKSLFKTNWYLLRGMWQLTAFPHPAITVFGGARVPIDSDIAKKAAELTKILAAEGFSILTGGGPGIMEAANLGAIEYLKECKINGKKCSRKLVSAGIGLVRLNNESANPYIQRVITMEHFFSRKWLMVRYSVGFAVFPGGFGTMDELFELVTLIQCNRMQKLPVLLFDSHYWAPLIEWIEARAMQQGLLTAEERKIIRVVDDVYEAAEIIKTACKQCQESVLFNGINGSSS